MNYDAAERKAIRHRLRYWYKVATDQQLHIGHVWYPQTAGHILAVGRRAGLFEPYRAILAAAALSAKTRWDLVLLHLENWLKDQESTMPALGVNKEKAVTLLDRGYAAIDVLGQGKVKDFALALCGDLEAVVVDLWMIRACLGLDTGIDSLTEKQYRFLQDQVRAVAHHYGVPPRDFQSVVWTSIRWRHTDPGWLSLDPLFADLAKD